MLEWQSQSLAREKHLEFGLVGLVYSRQETFHHINGLSDSSKFSLSFSKCIGGGTQNGQECLPSTKRQLCQVPI